jgi:autotransporter translocation and assembly factor TamB
MRKTIKIFFVTFILIILSLYIVLVTPPGHFILKKIIQRQLSHLTESPVKIDRFHTNLFSHLQLKNVIVCDLSNQKQPVLIFENLRIRYNLWGLFNKKIILKEVQINKPQIAIERDITGHYNFPKDLFRSQKDSLQKTSEPPDRYEIKIGSLKIINMYFNYKDQKDSIEIKLNQINLIVDSNGLGQSFVGKLDIESSRFIWRNLTQRIHQLNAKFDIDNNNFDLTDFTIRTDALTLESTGNYNLNDKAIISGKLLASVDLDFLNDFEFSKADNFYAGSLSIQCEINGNILQPNGMINLKMDCGIIHDIPVSNFNTNIVLKNQEAKLTALSMETFSGIVQAKGMLKQQVDSLQYQFDLSLQNFQLSELLKKLYHEKSSNLQGILTGNFTIRGKGNEWEKLTAYGKINLSQLSILTRPVQDIQTNFNFMKGKINFNFQQNESQINLTGVINSDSSITGKFEGNLTRVEPIANLAKLQDLKGKLKFAGNLNGRVESPTVNMNFHFWDGSYQGFPLTNIEGGIDFNNNQLIFSNLTANGSTSNLQPIAQYLSIDSLAGTLSYHIAANGNLDELTAKAEINWDTVRINNFNFDNLNLNMKTSEKDIFVDKLNIKKQNTLISTSGHVNLHDGIFVDLNTNIFETGSADQIISKQGLLKINGKLNNDIVDAKFIGEDIFIAALFQFIPSGDNVNGKLNFDSHIYGNLNRPDFNITWNLINPIYQSKSLDSLFGDLKYANNSLTISEITASNKDGKLSLMGEFPINFYQPDRLSLLNPLIKIEANNFALNILEPFLGDSIFIDGKLSAQIQFQGDWQNPRLEGELKIDNANLTTPYFSEIDSLYLNSLFSGQHFRLEKFEGKIHRYSFDFNGNGRYDNVNSFDASLVGNISQIGQIKIQGNRQSDQTISGQLILDDLNLNNLSQIIPVTIQLRGLVDMAIDVTGTPSSPFIAMKITGDQIGIEKAILDSLKVNAYYDKDLINIYESGFKIGNGKISFKGNIPFNYFQTDSSRSLVNNIQLESYANDLDIDWLRPFFPGIVNLQGKVNYNLKTTGTLDNPDINGVFNLTNGIVKLKNINPEVNEINVAISFNKDQVKIDNFLGKLETGNFNLQGQTNLNNRKLSNTEFTLTLDKIKFISPKIFSVSIENGNLALTQKDDRFIGKGTIRLKEAKYIQDYKPRISQLLTQIPNRFQADKSASLSKLTLDVIIQGQENIWIENNLAKLQMTSNLNLFGTLAQPNISGRVIINKGYVLYLDRKFKITNGVIDFSDPHRINPYIDITGVCTVTDYQSAREKNYTITLKLSGLLEKPDFLLLSDPQLDKADIIAVLTVGRTRDSIFPQSESTSGSSFQQIMIDRFKEITSQRIAGMTEQRLSRALALENISIEGNLFQLDKSWGPRVTATKQLANRINITYSTVVGHANEQQIKLGYQLFKNFSVIGSTSQRGESGLDLKWHIKFY